MDNITEKQEMSIIPNEPADENPPVSDNHGNTLNRLVRFIM